MGSRVERPLRLAIVDDYAVVVAGVAAFLSAERIDVVETGASTSVVSDVDIVLFDTFGQIQGEGIDLEDFVRDSDAKVVVYSWNLQPQLIDQALAAGACGYLSKVLTGPEIVRALERVMTGEIVVLTGDNETSVGAEGDWPGRSSGLSSREAEILALITQGLSNQEVAARAFISMNSVKTYIRSTYRKVGVDNRAQAVAWGLAHGFAPPTEQMAPLSAQGRGPRTGAARGMTSALRGTACWTSGHTTGRERQMAKSGHTPPEGVQRVGQRAVRWIDAGKAGRNFTDVGRARAHQLARGEPLSDAEVKKVKAYFARHAVDKKASGFTRGTDGFPSPGRVAWDAWGGDPGERWVRGIDV